MPKLNLQNLLFLGAAKPGSGSGGGSVDYSRVVEKSATIPTASEQTLSKVYMYTGDTNETYTHGYIYECKATPVYSDSTTFEPATISGTVVTETNNALSALAGQYIHGDVTSIASGTLTFDSEGNLWIFYGYDSENTEVGHFQLYQEDYEDAGFTFTGTPQNNDVVAFTCTITQTSSIYYWERIDVQPEPAKELPTQAGNSGKFLTTNGVSPSWTTPASAPVVPATMPTLAVADWSSNTQTVNVTGVTASNVVFVSPAPASASDYASAGIVCTAQGSGTLTFTCTTTPTNAITVNVVILG